MSKIFNLIFYPGKFFHEIKSEQPSHALKYFSLTALLLSLENIFMIYFPLIFLPNSHLAEIYSTNLNNDLVTNLLNALNLFVLGIPRTIILFIILFVTGYIGIKIYKINFDNQTLLKLSLYAVIPSVIYYILNDAYLFLFLAFPALGYFANAHKLVFEFLQFFGLFYCFYLLIEGIKTYNGDRIKDIKKALK